MPPFKVHTQPDKREFYWLVLALAHSGARLSEILQLYKSDVRQVEGVTVFEIKEGKGQILKNTLSVRLTPLHANLVASGFLDWHASQPEGRLFSVVYGRGVTITSRWFSTILLDRRIKTKDNTLYSLRHSVAQMLERSRCPYSISRRLQGHATGTDVQSRTHCAGLAFDLRELKGEIDKLNFPLLP